MYFLPDCCPDYKKGVIFYIKVDIEWQKKRIIYWETATQNTFFQTFMDFLTNFEFSVYIITIWETTTVAESMWEM